MMDPMDVMDVMSGGGSGNEIPSLLPKRAKRSPYCIEKSEFKHMYLMEPTR